MQYLPLESEERLSMQSVHRYRLRLVGNRPQLIIQATAYVLEHGIAMSQAKYKSSARLPEIVEDVDNGLPDQIRSMLVIRHLSRNLAAGEPLLPFAHSWHAFAPIRRLHRAVLVPSNDHRRGREIRTPVQ